MQHIQRVLIMGFIFLGLTACGSGGVSKSKEISTLCDFGSLYTSIGTCIKTASVDVDGDGVIDGLDLNNDGIPDVIFSRKAGSDVIAAIDINNDGSNDYFHHY